MEKTYNYMRVYNDLKGKILSGGYAVGERLPTEGQLQDTFGVSRITVKKAMEMLAEEGLVERYPGKGTFVLKHSGTVAPMQKKAAASRIHNAIGVVMNGFGSSFGLEFLQGVAEEANRHGLTLLSGLCYSSLEEEQLLIQRLIASGAQGIVIMPFHSENGINAALVNAAMDGFPLVLTDRYLEGFPLPYVGTDHVEAAFHATQYLLGLGHENIGLISSAPTTTSIIDRESGYMKAYAMTKFRVHPEYLVPDIKSTMPGQDTPENFRADVERMKRYYRENPSVTALMCIDYPVMRICETAAREAGIDIPSDLSLVCFDAPHDGFAEFEYTHLCQPEKEMGKTAVRMLLDVLHGDREPKRVNLPATLRIGMSTDIPGG